MISAPEQARRLARALAADVVLYNDHLIQSGLVEGNLDTALAEALQEAIEFYEGRVMAELVQSTNFLERAFVQALLERLAGAPPGTQSWQLALSRIRPCLLPRPACPGCRAPLPVSRVIGAAKVEPEADPAPRWRFLLSCPACLAVGRFDWTEGFSQVAEAGLEATGAVVARLRERLHRAVEAGRGDEELKTVLQGERWLLSIPEVFDEALPALGRPQVRLACHLDVVDPDPNARVFFPLSYLELRPSAFPEMTDEIFPWHRRGGHARHQDMDVLLAGTRVKLTGSRGSQWLVGRSEVLIGRHWRAVDGFLVDAVVVEDTSP